MARLVALLLVVAVAAAATARAAPTGVITAPNSACRASAPGRVGVAIAPTECPGGAAQTCTACASYTPLVQSTLASINASPPPAGACLEVAAGVTVVGNLRLSGAADCVVVTGNFLGDIETLGGNDVVEVTGVVSGTVALGDDDDCLYVSAGRLAGSAKAGDGDDRLLVFAASFVSGRLDAGDGADVVHVGATGDAAPSYVGDVRGGDGDDSVVLEARSMAGDLDAGDGDDEVVSLDGVVHTVRLGDGADRYEQQEIAAYTTASAGGAGSHAAARSLDGGKGAECVGVHGGQENGSVVGRVQLGGGADSLTLFDNAVVDGGLRLGGDVDAVGLLAGAVLNGDLEAGSGHDNVYVTQGGAPANTIVNGDVELSSKTNSFVVADGGDGYVLVNGDARVGKAGVNTCAIGANMLADPYLLIRDGVRGCTGSTAYIHPMK